MSPKDKKNYIIIIIDTRATKFNKTHEKKIKIKKGMGLRFNDYEKMFYLFLLMMMVK